MLLLLATEWGCGVDSVARDAGQTGSGGSGDQGSDAGTAKVDANCGWCEGDAAGFLDGGAWDGMPPATTLPPLHVDGTKIKDPSGKTIVLRGVSLPDLGTIYQWSNGEAGIKARIDALATAGILGHVIRFPIYPRTNVNQKWPYYSPAPFPIGPRPAVDAGLTYTMLDLSPEAYVAKILRPAVDYATSKNLYVIIDFHQIDDTAGQSGNDASLFWTFLAPAFKDYTNVIYEAFNEPIDIAAASSSAARWEAYRPHVQSWVDTIRAAAPTNLIVVGAPSWDQNVGPAAMTPIQGTNLVYAAHVYPGNWSAAFKNEVATAIAAHPLFFTEWGFDPKSTDANLMGSVGWGADLRATLDANGASWTAWVADDKWSPPLFTSTANGTLSDFGSLVKSWLADKVDSDWVQ